ncbi:uncharacterized protein LOC134675475 [Cydia fagiglandana]|uniref:uncharacterized protein LOC134675475 n=1 Tax=Cydia fagiglandana TaxID=1458189 RepID=UPI002FEE365C
METKKTQVRSRFNKLSLKKNKTKFEEIKPNRSSDVFILDDSFDRLKLDFPRVQSTPKLGSPIVINDSDEFENELPKEVKQPSKAGNVSFNLSNESPLRENLKSRPSIGGWSPAQQILCATPRTEPVPSTPKDKANESLEKCSIKKIHHSQRKLLDDIYGEVWKSIPTLFKTVSHKNDIDGISKKLNFNDDDDDSDKENIHVRIKKTKELYLTDSERKHVTKGAEGEKSSKKKLFTEKIVTPQPTVKKTEKPAVKRSVNSTVKKKLPPGKSVTELVKYLDEDVDSLAKRVDNVTVTPDNVKRLTFMGSLADYNVPSWRCHPEAFQYRDNYKNLREQLTRRLYEEFNRVVFNNALDNDLPIVWDSKLRSTAGTTTNRLVKSSRGDRIRTSSIKLSVKVLDTPQRVRDTLIHELCHAATWLVDSELRAGHGPLWKKWASRALRAIPELGDISRCHDMEIHYKYTYKCTKCGYSIQRHSKSIDITKKCCGYCRGTFEIIVNKKTKDGHVVSTPARKAGANEFAMYVKENYGTVKEGKTHAQVMKILGEQFSAKKKPKETS